MYSFAKSPGIFVVVKFGWVLGSVQIGLLRHLWMHLLYFSSIARGPLEFLRVFVWPLFDGKFILYRWHSD